MAGGRLAQSRGKSFEEIFQYRCNATGVKVTRIPDGCRQVGRGKLIRVKSPFDWIISWEGKTAFVDTKAYSGGAYYPPSLVDQNQVTEFEKHRAAGSITAAGYLVHLRKSSSIVWIPSYELADLSLNTLKNSQHSIGDVYTFDPRHILLLNPSVAL